MIIFEAYGKKCSIAENWSDITLNTAIELHLLSDQFPTEIKELYKLLLSEQTEEVVEKRIEIENNLSIELKSKVLPELYGKVIQSISDVPGHILNLWTPAERTAFYLEYAFKFIAGILYLPFDFKQKGITKFTHKGVEYFLPISQKILGTEKPMANTTAIEFTEVANLEIESSKLAGGKYKVAATIIAILCRPKDEKYDEQTSLNRVPLFHDLPMDIVWEVFFCFIEPSILLNQQNRISFLQKQVQEKKETL